jgi:SAM-dependent methyltransferase
MQLEEYDRMFALEDRYWWFVGRRRVALRLLRGSLSAPSSRSRILDLGCGTGVIATELAQWADPVGLDMSEHALAHCRQRGVTALVQADGEALPLRDRSVQGVLALDIFEHIQGDRAAFAECYRVLKPGGVLVLSVPAYRYLWGPHDVALMHHRRYTKSEIRARLEEAGFRVERASYSVFFLFPIVLLIRLVEKLKPGPPRASLPKVPGWLNRALIALQEFEAACIAKLDLPWGSSVIAVARRPER